MNASVAAATQAMTLAQNGMMLPFTMTSHPNTTRTCFRQRESMNGWIHRDSATSRISTPDCPLSCTALSLNSRLYALTLRGPALPIVTSLSLAESVNESEAISESAATRGYAPAFSCNQDLY